MKRLALLLCFVALLGCHKAPTPEEVARENAEVERELDAIQTEASWKLDDMTAQELFLHRPEDYLRFRSCHESPPSLPPKIALCAGLQKQVADLKKKRGYGLE